MPREATRAIRVRLAAVTAAIVGWGGLAILGINLYQATPREAGFDLELVLDAGRRWSAGGSLYPSLGTASATDLFYSYPPPIAQAASVLGGIPTWLVLVFLAVGAVSGTVAVAHALASNSGRDPLDVSLVVLGALPLVFPLGIGLLFGNLDVLVPAAFGAVLVALLAPSTPVAVLAGVALAIVSVAKVYPAVIGLWLVARFVWRSDERPTLLPVIASAATTGLLMLAGSVLVGGFAPWGAWLRMLTDSGSVGLLDTRNIGPAALLATGLGLGETGARVLQVAVLAAVVLAVISVARFGRDPLASFTAAAAASIVVLPITWLHYAAALIPSGVAYALRGRAWTSPATLLVVAAIVDGVAALLVPAVAWLGVAAIVAMPLVPDRVALRPREATA